MDQQKRPSKATLFALRLLSYRDRSRFEIESRLKKAEFSQEEVDQVLEKLAKLRLIDDSKFVWEYLEIKTKRFWGPKRVKFELLKLGVDEKTIDEVAKKYDWKKVFDSAVAKYKGKLTKKAFIGKLSRLGFPNSMIVKEANDD